MKASEGDIKRLYEMFRSKGSFKADEYRGQHPAVIYYDIVEGDKIVIHVAPKGFGSENMSTIKMLKPSDGPEGVKKTVIEAISRAGQIPALLL